MLGSIYMYISSAAAYLYKLQGLLCKQSGCIRRLSVKHLIADLVWPTLITDLRGISQIVVCSSAESCLNQVRLHAHASLMDYPAVLL